MFFNNKKSETLLKKSKIQESQKGAQESVGGSGDRVCMFSVQAVLLGSAGMAVAFPHHKDIPEQIVCFKMQVHCLNVREKEGASWSGCSPALFFARLSSGHS